MKNKVQFYENRFDSLEIRSQGYTGNLKTTMDLIFNMQISDGIATIHLPVLKIDLSLGRRQVKKVPNLRNFLDFDLFCQNFDAIGKFHRANSSEKSVSLSVTQS